MYTRAYAKKKKKSTTRRMNLPFKPTSQKCVLLNNLNHHVLHLPTKPGKLN
jgi:hypothetical protein